MIKTNNGIEYITASMHWNYSECNDSLIKKKDFSYNKVC